MTGRRSHPAGRPLRHADRGVPSEAIRLGGRWSRAWPLLLVAPVDAVLVRSVAPISLHTHNIQVAVRPCVTVRHATALAGPRAERLVTVVRTVPRTGGTPAPGQRSGGNGPARPGSVEPIPLRPTRARMAALALPVSAGDHSPGAPASLVRPPAVRAAVADSRGPERWTRPGVLTAVPVRRVTLGRPGASVPPGPTSAVVRPAILNALPVAVRPGRAEATGVDVEDLTRRVVDAIDRRLIAHRERMGGR